MWNIQTPKYILSPIYPIERSTEAMVQVPTPSLLYINLRLAALWRLNHGIIWVPLTLWRSIRWHWMLVMTDGGLIHCQPSRGGIIHSWWTHHVDNVDRSRHRPAGERVTSTICKMNEQSARAGQPPALGGVIRYIGLTYIKYSETFELVDLSQSHSLARARNVLFFFGKLINFV